MRRAVRRLLLADAEAKDGDGSMPCAVERFQVDRRKTRRREEPDAVAEQHRQDAERRSFVGVKSP